MKDTFKSSQTGDNRNEKRSRLLRRPGPGEKNLIPVALGPCAPVCLEKLSHAGEKFCLVFMMLLVLMCLNVAVEAVPDFKPEFAIARSFFGTCDTGGVIFINDFLPYRHPSLNNYGLGSVVNIDWTAAQDYKYKFLENVLYNYLGGSYEPCSIGHPFRSEFRHHIVIRIEEPDDRKCPDVTDIPGNTGNPGDIYAGLVFSSRFLHGDSMCFMEPEMILLDVCAVPEPSSVVLFLAAALGFLPMKKV